MTRTARRLAAVAALALAPILLAACGSTPAAARHVVGAPAAPTYPSPGPGTDPLDAATVQQAVTDVQSGLHSLDSGLAQVDADLTSPQGDS